jgi:hypothetical protein
MTPAEELWKLKKAITTSGYGVLKASNGWTIVDVSEKAKQDEARELEIINRNVDLEVAIEKALKLINERTSPVLAEIRKLLKEAIHAPKV